MDRIKMTTPKSFKKQFSVKLDIDHIERIRKEAAKDDRSMNYVVCKALLKAFPPKKRGDILA